MLASLFVKTCWSSFAVRPTGWPICRQNLYLLQWRQTTFSHSQSQSMPDTKVPVCACSRNFRPILACVGWKNRPSNVYKSIVTDSRQTQELSSIVKFHLSYYCYSLSRKQRGRIYIFRSKWPPTTNWHVYIPLSSFKMATPQ